MTNDTNTDDSTEDVTELPDYDDRVLLEPEDIAGLSGAVFPVVESEGGERIAIDIRFDSGDVTDLLDIADALLDASNDYRDDYYKFMNDVDPDGNQR